MLMIRLQRTGRKNQAAFRAVVIDSHASPKAGKNVELLGSYNPHSNVLQVEKDRILYWMGKGAQVSDTMRNLLISNKIIDGKKVNVLPRKSPPAKEAAPEATPAAEAPASEVEVNEAPQDEAAVEAPKEEETPAAA